MMWSLYELIHIWTAVVDESEEWSEVGNILKNDFISA